jgi:microsomal dipeptidase-like Zn-dependent dipeptidase
MDMKRFLFALAVVAAAGGGGCNKPSPDDCRQAISNMEKLLGTDSVTHGTDNDGEIRRCRGGSSKEAVDCAIKATSVDQLRACAFMSPKSK